LFANFQLTPVDDVGFWILNKDGKYTVKSLYLEMLNPGVRDWNFNILWKTKMPLKIKKIAWMCFRGRIQVKSDLKAKGWPGDPGCKLCGELETSGHLIFECPLSNFSWCCMSKALGWSRTPTSFNDFTSMVAMLGGSQMRIKTWTMFGALAWAIWLQRNDHVFNNKVGNSSLTQLFKMIFLMSQWTFLLGPKHEEGWKALIEKIRLVARRMQLTYRPRSGVG
jgi:hypothetical protein